MKAYRSPRKFEKPRPLKFGVDNNGSSNPSSPNNNIYTENKDEGIQEELDDYKKALENMSNFACNSIADENTEHLVTKLYKWMKSNGPALDSKYCESMDECFDAMRLVIRKNTLSGLLVVKLVELIEWRATGWRENTKTEQFYDSIGKQANGPLICDNTNANLLLSSSPIDTGNTPGKFSKSKTSGKNNFKDEIVIKNSDSGKVASGAKDRLIQITGNNEESIGNAKMLIEDTIRRNSSPERERYNLEYPNHAVEPDQDEDNYCKETPNGNLVQIPVAIEDVSKGKFFLYGDSESLDMIYEAKEVLENYFKKKVLAPASKNQNNPFDHQNGSFKLNGSSDGPLLNGNLKQQNGFSFSHHLHNVPSSKDNGAPLKPVIQRICYSRDMLLDLFNSSLSHQKINAVWEIENKFPMLIRPKPGHCLPNMNG